MGCCGTSLAPEEARRSSHGLEFVDMLPALEELPQLEALVGEWRCDENGVEFTIAQRPDGRLHYATSWSNVALLWPRSTAYTGNETSWNCGGSREVRLLPHGNELQWTLWNVAAGHWNNNPWVLRRLYDREAASRGRYVELASLWDALAEGHTLLLKGSWLLALYHSSAVLPRRQDLPLRAAWDPAELQHAVEAGTVRIVGLSYCWKERNHPDPQGEQLQIIASLIQRRLGYTYPDGTCVLADLAIFWDYPCLFQKPRSAPEQEAFDRSLLSVSLWYAHKATEAWLLTRVPHGCRAYNERGWPVFERAVCSLITPEDSFLDVGLWEADGEEWWQIADTCRAQREPPMRPRGAAKLLGTKAFTSSADLEKLRDIYERTYYEVMGSVRILDFANLPRWGDREAMALAECLPDCPQLEELQLSYDSIGAAGAGALGAAAAKCGRLRVVSMIQNPLGDEGAAALLDGVADCRALEQLLLRQTDIQDRGAEAIAAALPRFHTLRALVLRDCQISDAGAAALGAVLAQCPSLEALYIGGNHLTDEGKAALNAAWVRAGKDAVNCAV